ncbi:hypothetical protein POX_h09680 [Penicillium oxalicum]|uniref:hypothetical protein n=1 Tax=Penicillium oxalicum TaxID=69781 RepID=UPI0020B87C25|nr:hypothetical protein POX_h09680 [Penicillium oxalicum]KAI2785917.1 hypothetical protein POX_h09680 [Penicillium oxalicum]
MTTETLPIYHMWLAGEEKAGLEADLLPIEDPATGQVFAHCHSASAQDVETAITTAHETFKSGIWSRASRHHRADILDKCATLLSDCLPELIKLEVRQTGRVIKEMQAQVPSLIRWFKYYASLLRVEERPVLPTMGKLHNFIDRVPLGVVIQITPFNHPLLIAVKKIAPALAAGNSVILKPSELTPLTSILLGKILAQAGIPAGVFSVLPGLGATTGKALVSHGLAPLVVFDDADLDVAVNGIAFGSFIASGQTCIASTRIIVHSKIQEQVLQKLRVKIEGIRRRIGSPSNIKSVMGPLVSEKQLLHVERVVEQSLASDDAVALTGAKRMTGTSLLDNTDLSAGYFYEPTILVSADGNKSITRTAIWREEAFGPVIVVVAFDNEADAIALANDTEFGLGASIWTQNLSRAFRVSEQIEAGIVWVNTHHRNDPSSPWGGAKSASGVGSENGLDAYHAYTTTKSTIINYAPSKESMTTDDWFGEEARNARYG